MHGYLWEKQFEFYTHMCSATNIDSQPGKFQQLSKGWAEKFSR